MVVLVTGASGQVGQSLQFIAHRYPELTLAFCDSKTMDITDKDNCNRVFAQLKPDYCINTAGYTAVDKAEAEAGKAQRVNVAGAKNVAETCKAFNTVLLHISTDFVFDGQSNTPYTEASMTHPLGIYGQTKLDGEKAIQEIWDKHLIIRTSWIYSQFGHNFMKTMLRLAHERDSIAVVNDQIGTPTNALDLAEALLEIIIRSQKRNKESFGIYHFSNDGQCSWYDFAKKIFEVNEVDMAVHPIKTADYPTPAKRPAYSVLDKTKIKTVFGIDVKDWETSLKDHA